MDSLKKGFLFSFFSIANSFAAGEAPRAPSELVVVKANEKVIVVEWVDNSSNESGFQVERAEGAKAWELVKVKPANTNSYHDQDIVVNKSYRYRVRAFFNPKNENNPRLFSDYNTAVSIKVIPVNGGWSNHADRYELRPENGQRIELKACDNPAPSNGGLACKVEPGWELGATNGLGHITETRFIGCQNGFTLDTKFVKPTCVPLVSVELYSITEVSRLASAAQFALKGLNANWEEFQTYLSEDSAGLDCYKKILASKEIGGGAILKFAENPTGGRVLSCDARDGVDKPIIETKSFKSVHSLLYVNRYDYDRIEVGGLTLSNEQAALQFFTDDFKGGRCAKTISDALHNKTGVAIRYIPNVILSNDFGDIKAARVLNCEPI